MIKKTMCFCLILFVFISAALIFALDNGQEDYYELTVFIEGIDGYQPHDELVMIRGCGDESADILFETYSDGMGVTSFFIPNGTYWLDIRNVWIEFNISAAMEITYPYLLFEDAEFYTKDYGADVGEGISFFSKVNWSLVGLALLFCIILFSVVFILKKNLEGIDKKK